MRAPRDWFNVDRVGKLATLFRNAGSRCESESTIRWKLEAFADEMEGDEAEAGSHPTKAAVIATVAVVRAHEVAGEISKEVADRAAAARLYAEANHLRGLSGNMARMPGLAAIFTCLSLAVEVDNRIGQPANAPSPSAVGIKTV